MKKTDHRGRGKRSSKKVRHGWGCSLRHNIKQNNGLCRLDEKKPNAWGLYDMPGNLWDWCSDWYGEYPKGAVNNPIGPEQGSIRVFRGGSWFNLPAICRSAIRDGNTPSIRFDGPGFRVTLSPSGISKWAEPDQVRRSVAGGQRDRVSAERWPPIHHFILNPDRVWLFSFRLDQKRKSREY